MEKIRAVTEHKKQYLPLLLEADPSEEMIDRYLEQGELYLLEEDGGPAAVAVVLFLENGDCELKNLATQTELQGRGLASRLVDWLCRRYTDTCAAMVVGTSDYGVSFYTRLGFEPSHTVEDFFIQNYPTPLYDGNGAQCVHMRYLRRKLGRERGKPLQGDALRYEIITVDSPAYQSELALRQQVMRLPLGLDLYQGDLSGEGEYLHFVALDAQGKVWGVVVAHCQEDGAVEVRAAAVDGAAQRSGVGRRLMERMEEHCRAAGCREVVLHARKTAVGFYQRLGYALDPGEFLEVTIPHRRMRKKL